MSAGATVTLGSNVSYSPNSDEFWMQQAIRQAQNCLQPVPSSNPQSTNVNPKLPNPQSKIQNPKFQDVPIGAVCVYENRVVGCGFNRREQDGDPTAHAEVLALREAARNLGDWRLENVSLYVTLEPCPMCAGALWLARISRLVFGAWDSKAGACGSLLDIPRDPRLNHRLQVRGGVLEAQCAQLLENFFVMRRARVA